MTIGLAAAIAGAMLGGASPIHEAARLAAIAIPAQTSTLSIDVDLAGSREQILALDSAQDILLDLDGIEAERPPAVYFEIYVHSKGAPLGRSVGNLALFGTGIRSESTGEFRPAHVQLVITEEIQGAVRQSAAIELTFVAQGAGGGSTPRSASAISIRKPAILIAPRTRALGSIEGH